MLLFFICQYFVYFFSFFDFYLSSRCSLIRRGFQCFAFLSFTLSSILFDWLFLVISFYFFSWFNFQWLVVVFYCQAKNAVLAGILVIFLLFLHRFILRHSHSNFGQTAGGGTVQIGVIGFGDCQNVYFFTVKCADVMRKKGGRKNV